MKQQTDNDISLTEPLLSQETMSGAATEECITLLLPAGSVVETPFPSRFEKWHKILWRSLVPVKGYCNASTRLVKFIVLTLFGIVQMHCFIRWMDWEYKGRFHLIDFWVYESKEVVTDMIVFFIVGRLYQDKAANIDSIAWIGTAFLANIYSSGINEFAFLRHSFTLYGMNCTWPIELYIFCIGLALVISSLAIAHVQHMVQHNTLTRHLFEFALCTAFFMLPYTTSAYFHFHHWFAGWFLGMHASLHERWWSSLCMAWCWGLYINGIAAYGRDPILTCGYTYWIAQQQACPYLDCYDDALLQSPAPTMWNGTAPPTISPMNPPDWRNCSANAYHP